MLDLTDPTATLLLVVRALRDHGIIVRALTTMLDLTAVQREVSLLAQEISDHDTLARLTRVMSLAAAPIR